MVEFEKHVSKTAEQVALTWKLFFGLFFNTGMVVTLVNAGNPELRDSLPTKFLFNGQFEDFTPDWYEGVGQALTITMLINAVNPHIMQLVNIPMGNWTRWMAAGDEDNIVTQSELDQVYMPLDFSLAQRYAAVGNTFYVAYIYTSGMPMLVPVAMFTFW